jgi:hypothetical protein
MRVSYICRVHYLDLQAYLAKVYRMKGFDLLKAAGAVHGLCPEYIVTGRVPQAANAGQQMDNIRRGRITRNVDLILNVLCVDGFIPKGKYVIDTKKPPNPIEEYTRMLNDHMDPNHPDCVTFKKKHPSSDFQRRAKLMDKLAREHRENLEKTNE